MDIAGKDFGVAARDSHPNIEVRIFNPFSRRVSRTIQIVTRLGSVTRRMHDKSFTVDNQITIPEGSNIGNEYFEADPVMAFVDLDVVPWDRWPRLFLPFLIAIGTVNRPILHQCFSKKSR